MSIELISPFPDESLPKLWLWMKPYQSKTEFAGQDVESFMEIERRRPSRLKTWGVMLDIELGGYIELQPHGDRTAVLDMISKKSFFSPPIVRQALDAVFEEAFFFADLLLFFPSAKNGALAKMYRLAGARDCGWLPAPNGDRDKRVLVLSKGEWLERPMMQKGEAA